MAIRENTASYEVVVVGGGFSGVCAAIAAAREGAKVAIIQNRSVFGGTGSSEIRMHIVGANCHSSKENLRETGILEEILLENKRRNPHASFPVFDMIVWEKIHLEKNITPYLNTNVEEVVQEDGLLVAVIGHQNSTETKLMIRGKIFIDATGHGTVGVLAGAAFRTGTESRHEFQEPTAPEEANQNKMGNTIMFKSVDRGEPVRFEKPVWANTYSEEDLKYRPHVDQICAQMDGGGLVDIKTGTSKGLLPELSNADAGYWWIELGGDSEDIIGEGETIRDKLLKVVYGVWDHLKNDGDHGLENYDLDWVGMVPGYRESRRLDGDYILNENDIRGNKIFEDAVAYGGWPMDVHVPGGIKALDSVGSRVYNFEGCYSIPYRCYYSKNIPNLMMAGRNISASKMAFSSTRVMGTCAVGGQAAGTAAAMAVKHNCSPKEIGYKYIHDLQQTLLKNDCFIPGHSNEDEEDLARKAHIAATSETETGAAKNINNGVSRSVGNEANCWISGSLETPQSISLKFEKSVSVKKVRLTFDTNLSSEIQPSLLRIVLNRQVQGLPPELVKTYDVTLLNKGIPVTAVEVKNNGQRLNVHSFDEVACDEITVTVKATHGCGCARIFEIRVY